MMQSAAQEVTQLRSDTDGGSLIELAVILPILLLILLGAVDMGRAYYAGVEVSSAAAAGAAYGTLKPNDVLGMQSAAVLDAGDLTGLTSLATWGCECSDGSSATLACMPEPACAVNTVQYVQVNTTLTYLPLFPYPGIPTSLLLKGNSRMRVGD